MKLETLAVAVLLGPAYGCGASTVVVPGTPHSVARAAASAYEAAGHACQIKADLAYCDIDSRSLPLLMGYNAKRQELLFATLYDTEAGYGQACTKVQAAQVLRPEWMVVRCDEIQLEDAAKTRKVVLSVAGSGRVPDRGMTRAELNRSAALFIQEAEGFLVRLQAVTQAMTTTTSAPVNDTPTVKL